MNLLFSIAFITGLAGSFHCVGMCGPIALALPVGNRSSLEVALSRILYNLGRIVTYSALGASFGYFGKTIYIAGYQQQLSILVGVFILLSIFSTHLTVFMPFQKFSNNIVFFLKKLFKTKSILSFLALGIVNGLLPCGLVYLSLAGAAASSSPVEGAMFMAFFGLGTAPMMFSISILPKFLSFSNRQKINKYLPVYTIFLALFFVLRGLNLGIPYMSPKFKKQTASQGIPVCHNIKKNT